MKEFTMSMFSSKEELYKAKAEYFYKETISLLEENGKLRDIIEDSGADADELLSL